MSVDATRWAWDAPVKSSAQRLILLSLADRAGEDHTCYPSNKRLADDTVLNLKTVQKAVNELIEMGLISDTGERKGNTKQVRVLQLICVNSREYNQPKNGVGKPTQKRNNTENGNDTKNGAVNPPITNPILEGNDTKNGICNEPKNGLGNLSLNLSMNLSGQHDWIPDQNQLIAVLNSAGQQQNLKLIFGLPDFEFQLGAFNTHFDGLVLSDSKKLYKFANWIIDKFQRYQKQNPDYVIQTEVQPEQQNQSLINLPSKPKGFLGAAQ